LVAKTSVALVLAVALAPSTAWTQVPVGPEFQVSSFTTARQTLPAVSMDGSAGFVVVWQTFFGDPPAFKRGVLARRFDPSGTPLDAAAFQVNTYTTDDQMYPRVAASAGGEFVVVWDSVGQDGSGQGIFGRRYDAAGLPLSPEEFQVNTYTISDQMFPAIAGRPDGDVVVVWKSFRQIGSALDVIGQRYDALGLPAGPEFPVTSGTDGSHQYPEVATNTAGDFVVVYYREDSSTLSHDVFAQRFDATGTRVGGEILVNTFTTGFQLNPSVTMQPDGGFLVVWESFAQGGGDVMARRFDATGSPAGGEFRVNSYTTGGQGASPQVAADPDGNFVVVWLSAGQAGSGTHVFGQRLDPAGSPLGGEFRVGSSTWSQTQPSVAAAEHGVFVVVWATNPNPGPFAPDRILGQRFAPHLIFSDGFELPSGTMYWGEFESRRQSSIGP